MTEKKTTVSPDWHVLTAEQVIATLETRKEGLTKEEVAARAGEYGPNRFTRHKQPNMLMRVFSQLKSPVAIVLLAAFLVTFVLAEFVDAGVIAFALLIAVVVGAVQEGRASRAFRTLADSQSHEATVFRGGSKHVIDAENLVPGDVVEIADGMQVPADIRLFETNKLALNEAVLTGEWLAVNKDPEEIKVGTPFTDRTNMAWMGTFVSKGQGRGVVVETGDTTFVGSLAKDIGGIKDEKTPLQRQMQKLSRIMLIIVGVIVVSIFVLGIVRNEPVQTMLLTAIAIAVASIPEGLPAAVTIVLAVAMESLLRRGGLVRSLLAAETLGSTTFILTDKTGTLTEARMEITKVIGLDHTAARNTETGEFDTSGQLKDFFDVSLTATDAFFDTDEEKGTFTAVGEPMERMILQTAEMLGISTQRDSYRAGRTDYLAFTSENRFAAGLSKHDGKTRLCVNGAPEYLLSHAASIHTKNGVRKLSDDDRAYFEKIIDEHTARGERLIGVAYRDVSWKEIPDTEAERLLDDIVFVGLLVFHDPVRSGVKEAIQAVQGAGAQVALVTGDNQKTALSVAIAVGIAKEGDTALLGEDVEAMGDKELHHALKTVPVFARVLPREKMRLVEILQAQNEIVAMTGDGINDSPALKRAHIGVALGSGTEVAKEASDLVLVNDSFAILRSAIEEGRRVISNLRKIIGYLFATSLSEVVLIGTALIVGGPIPLVPAQILWANIIEEGLMGLAFAFEPGEKNAMKRKPQDIRKQGILSRDIVLFLVLAVVVMSALLVLLYLYFFFVKMAPVEEIRSVMFLAVSIDSLFIAFSFRSLTQPLWQISFRSNTFFLISFVVSLGLLFVVLTIPFFRFLLSYEPLPLTDVLFIIGYGFLTMVTIEIGKWIFFERQTNDDTV